MQKIIFLCEGNICRSPSAEFMLKEALRKKGLLSEYDVSSRATILDTKGQEMSSRAREQLSLHQIPYEEHHAAPLTKKEFDEADYILIMDSYNLILLKRLLFLRDISKVHKLLEYTDDKRDIADPYFTGKFDVAYQDIEKGINGFVAYLEQKQNA